MRFEVEYLRWPYVKRDGWFIVRRLPAYAVRNGVVRDQAEAGPFASPVEAVEALKRRLAPRPRPLAR